MPQAVLRFGPAEGLVEGALDRGVGGGLRRAQVDEGFGGVAEPPRVRKSLAVKLGPPMCQTRTVTDIELLRPGGGDAERNRQLDGGAATSTTCDGWSGCSASRFASGARSPVPEPRPIVGGHGPVWS
jgi:hypothetical protein